VVLGRHRADVVTPNGIVVEFQNAALPAGQVAAREDFYGPMVWVVNAVEAFNDGRLSLRDKDGCQTFRCKQPRKWITLCQRRVVLDLGGGRMLRVKKIHAESKFAGWGYRLTVAEFRGWLLGASEVDGLRAVERGVAGVARPVSKPKPVPVDAVYDGSDCPVR
jgi:hypothetical protein